MKIVYSGWFGTSDSSSNAVMIHSGSTGPGSNWALVMFFRSNGGIVMGSTVAIIEVARGVVARIVAVVITLPAMVAARSACLGFSSPMSTSSGWFGTSDSSSNAVMIHSRSTGPGSD